MFGVENLFLFLTAGLLLNITPGPDMLYIAARSAAQGRWAGVVSALGIATGSLVHMTAAAFGLSALLMYSALAFQLVKWAGVVYLIYLGVRTLMKSGEDEQQQQELSEEPLTKIYREGVLVNVLNPKVALFFLAFLPQFVDPAVESAVVPIIFLGILFNVTGTAVNVIVAFGVAYVGRWIRRSRRARLVQTRVTGSIFIGLGLLLAFARRR